MCGILTLFSKTEEIPDSIVSLAIESLKHRGPDSKEFWISPNRRITLGHTRLSIIDLEGGTQPITNQDETLRIVVNGEFYDYERIQCDLKQWGYKLQTKSDSEIALHLYDRFGTQCLHHLRGEFAFVLWDRRNQLIFAARDRFGIKPLYYTVYRDTLYLASEVKALFAAGVPAIWDEESFFLQTQAVLLPNRTLFANIYQIPPGNFLIASQSQIQLHQYWDFNYPPAEKSQPSFSFEESVEQLRFHLTEAVRLRLRADVPVGFYLSGGLDSSTLLGIASHHMSDRPKAFTLAFNQELYNEENIAVETAKSVEADLEIISITESDLAENFANSIYHGESFLCFNAHSTAKYILSGKVRDAGYKVVLTGEGSDEIFGGYPHFRQDMLLHNAEGQDEHSTRELLDLLKQSNEISSGILLSEGTTGKLFSSVKQILGFVPAWIQSWPRHSCLDSVSFYSRDFVKQFIYSGEQKKQDHK